MKKLIEFALKNSVTFIVIPLIILFLGIVTLFKVKTDILPSIDSPVISVVWTYNGISASDMEKRIVTIAERNYTSTVSNIEHTESQSLYGLAVIKVFLQPGADINTAITQINAASQTILRALPPRATPPEVLKYTPSTVPVVQLVMSSKSLSMEDVTDIAQNHLKSQLAIIKGAQVPMPIGGKAKQIVIDLNNQSLETYGLTAMDVVNAVTNQNVILPAGSVKIGRNDYYVTMNNSPDNLDEINSFPIRTQNGITTYIRDVGHVHQGFETPSNMVRENKNSASLISIFKTEEASTLDVVSNLRKMLPKILQTIPKEVDVKQIFDQSIFVKNSIHDMFFSGVLAIILTSLMILLFLGNGFAASIVTVSIPLSIIFAIIVLYCTNQTLNMMTLGGLGLAIGMLVDDATVVIENILRNFKNNVDIKDIILHSAAEVATPAFFSTISICCVFLPVFLMSGFVKSLFEPMAIAIIFSMLASYYFSNTLVPVLASRLLTVKVKKVELLEKWHDKVNSLFEKFRNSYKNCLNFAVNAPKKVFTVYASVLILAIGLFPIVGSNFFPSVDTGEIRLHVYVQQGTRLEETAKAFSQIENTIREVIPQNEIGAMLDKIGLPNGGINRAFMDNSTIGVSDGEILITLNKNHKSTKNYIEKMRKVLNAQYPEYTFFFQDADIISKILNFGLSSPIDIKISGKSLDENYKITENILNDVKKIRGVKDAHIHQNINVPSIDLNIDRTRSSQMGANQDLVARNILTSLDSSTQTTPSYWVNPKTGVNYSLAVKVPSYRYNSISDVLNLPVSNNSGTAIKLSNVSSHKIGRTTNVITHYNILPTYDIFLNIQDRDLGSTYNEVNKVIQKYQKDAPRGTFIDIYGQAKTMNNTFAMLFGGILLSCVLVYLLAVINYQSFKDGFLVLLPIPIAICGVVFMLYASDTVICVPALMGMIMAVGVSCANSILLTSFAVQEYKISKNAFETAIKAGVTRFRPILMTTTAMILGMLPMALGIGEGGSQNAPLGKSVIGGLICALFATLFVVPTMFKILNTEKINEK